MGSYKLQVKWGLDGSWVDEAEPRPYLDRVVRLRIIQIHINGLASVWRISSSCIRSRFCLPCLTLQKQK